MDLGARLTLRLRGFASVLRGHFVPARRGQFEAEFGERLYQSSLGDWLVEHCRKQGAFLGNDLGLLVAGSGDDWIVRRVCEPRMGKEVSLLGVFWLWLLVERIIRATCSPETTGM